MTSIDLSISMKKEEEEKEKKETVKLSLDFASTWCEGDIIEVRNLLENSECLEWNGYLGIIKDIKNDEICIIELLDKMKIL
ncbi:hypothetical protein RFI_28559 [Reticulomyxa filosa]|uniref:Uncharacterized protein n=1 Tax=Reticulomyxa filosa TaxID=46433 RepID=X6M4H6_RETFI|nr:hypothetical protein RFI_28559 [Reticulomyxa filosa]|eukprot:ETO08829.1 hypothetical protein RFI_28559 [Reticulomyxa filosa]